MSWNRDGLFVGTKLFCAGALALLGLSTGGRARADDSCVRLEQCGEEGIYPGESCNDQGVCSVNPATCDDSGTCTDAFREIDCAPGQDWYNYGNWLPSMVEYFLPRSCDSQQRFPVVMLFHGGAGNVSHRMYEADGYTPNSALKNRRGHSARLIKLLLQEGYAVIVPYATNGSNWMTNSLVSYTATSDYKFLRTLIEEIQQPSASSPAYIKQLDANNMFATGISDGGAQASRMARTWPTAFRAVAINEGSWSTCSADFGLGVVCNPVDITWSHPPTLFTHAVADPTVSVEHVNIYARELEEARQRGNPIEWRAVIALSAGNKDYRLAHGVPCSGTGSASCVRYDVQRVDNYAHDWLREVPEEHLGWFNRFLVR